MKNFLKIAAPLLLFLAAAFCAVYAIGTTGSASKERELESVRNTIQNGITMCYSIEGAYPENLEYLKENYGISYNEEKYIVHYECFASNIRPAFTVIERNDRF